MSGSEFDIFLHYDPRGAVGIQWLAVLSDNPDITAHGATAAHALDQLGLAIQRWMESGFAESATISLCAICHERRHEAT